MKQRRRVRAVVVSPGQTWFADDTTQRPWFHQTPEWAMGDFPRLIETAGRSWFDAANTDGVVIARPPLSTVADRNAVTVEFIKSAAALGWKTTGAGQDTGWFSLWSEQHKVRIHFGIAPWINQGRTPLFKLDDHANVVVERLSEYERLTGATWRGTGGMSGCAGIRDWHDGKKTGGSPLWVWKGAPTDVTGCSYELRPSKHFRPPSEDELVGFEVQHFDTRAQYLAAANVAELAWSAPEQRGPQAFDPDRPGYWLVDRAQLPADAAEVITEDTGKHVWVTTPVVKYALELSPSLGGYLEIHDSVTCARKSRLLRGWSDRLKDAREATGEGSACRIAVKDTYARTVGMLARDSGRIYRPDWRDTIVDTARINLVRKVRTVGVSPLRWNVDAVWVAVPIGAPPVFADSGKIGGLRHVATTSMTDYLGRFNR